MHNYFVLRAGKQIERAENTVLPSFVTAFTGNGYLDSLVLTAGGRQFVAKATRVAGNFDPTSVPFVRYTARFEYPEMDDLPVTGASMAMQSGENLVNFAGFSGATAKQKDVPLDVECTLYLSLSAGGVKLLSGENPLYSWLLGENREGKWSLYPLARADVLSTVTALPAYGRISVQVETVGNEIVFTAKGIPRGFSAVALLLDGVAVLTYETINEGEEFEYLTLCPTADTLFLDEPLYDYRGEAIKIDQTCKNPDDVRKRPFGFTVGTAHVFPCTLFPSQDADVVYGRQKFAFVMDTGVEIFKGLGQSEVPLMMDFGQTVTSATFGGDNYFLVALKDGTAMLFDLAEERPRRRVVFQVPSGARSMALSENGDHALIAFLSGIVVEYEIKEEQAIIVSSEEKEGYVDLDTQNMTAIRYEEGTLSEYTYHRGATKLRTISDVDGYVTSLHVFGNIVDVKTATGQRILVEKGTGTTTQFENSTETVCISPDGTYVAVTAKNGITTLSVYDGEFGELIAIEANFPVGAKVFPLLGGAVYRTGDEVFVLPILEEFAFLVFPVDRGNTEYKIVAIEKSLSESLSFSFCASV